MKYYLDTEFIEGFHKPLFGKKRHFIDLISIGIVAEDGRELYLISNEYNYKDADEWVKDNVIMPLYTETVHGDARNVFSAVDFHKHYGLSNKQIAEEVKNFCGYERGNGKFLRSFDVLKNNWQTRGIDERVYREIECTQPEFYAYYADYDWVVFCSLFGRMIDLPKGFPMYCKDLKQSLDEKVYQIYPGKTMYHKQGILDTLEDRLVWVKNLDGFPKQANEHNALDDAKWNQKLHNFLINYK